MRVNLKRVNLLVLVLAVFMPNIGVTFETFGFHWTLGRILFFISMIILICRARGRIYIRFQNSYWAKLLVFWLLYGGILMILSQYSPLHNGFVELLAVFNGFLCIYIIDQSNVTEWDIDFIVTLIFWILLFYIVFGFFELFTGIHFPTSIYNDLEILQRDQSGIRNTRGCTGPMYGENDFSAMLTCLLPIGLYKRKWRPLFIISLIGVVIINQINDANICQLAIVIGGFFYLVCLAGLGKKNGKIIRLIMLIVVVVIAIFAMLNFSRLARRISFFNVLKEQIKGYQLGYGSLLKRVILYIDSIKAAANTLFIGIGPAGFEEYFKAHPSASGLTNPHNLYLEVLVQYGIFITVFFVAGLIRLLSSLISVYKRASNKDDKNRYLALSEIFVVYAIVCVASSSFIGYSYQWILLGIGAAAVNGRIVEKQVERIGKMVEHNMDFIASYSRRTM